MRLIVLAALCVLNASCAFTSVSYKDGDGREFKYVSTKDVQVVREGDNFSLSSLSSPSTAAGAGMAEAIARGAASGAVEGAKLVGGGL